MRKTILILLLALWPALAHAQSPTAVASALKGGPTLPATCHPATSGSKADVFVKTGASAGLYTCSAANTWTIVSGGSGIGTVNGIVKGDGAGTASAAVAGTDYLAPTGSGASLTNVVNSITGTASQVTASGSTGAVTLSLPQSIATTSAVQFGTVLASNPYIPTNGLIAEYLFNWPNYVPYSAALNNTTYWTRSKLAAVNAGAGCTVSCVAPDSTNTANEMVENSAAGQHYLQLGASGVPNPALSFAAGETFTLSVYGKANTRNFLFIEIDDGSSIAGSYFNLSTCATGNLTGPGSALVVGRSTVSSVNGWCRVSMTYTSLGAPQVYFMLASANGTNSYTGDGASSLLLNGAQINAGASVATYTATTDLLTISDVSGNGNNGTLAGTQSANGTPNTSPQGLRLVPYSSQSQRVNLPAALTSTMQTIVIVADVPPTDSNGGNDRPFFGSSAALGPKLLVQNKCANGSGVTSANFNVRPCWWFGTSGTPTSTAGTAISAPQLPPGPQMVAVVMGAGAQDRVYINGSEYGYYNSSTIAPSSSASVSRSGLSAAVPQIGGDTSLSLYLPQVTGTTSSSHVYFAAVYSTQLTAKDLQTIYANVKTWLAQTKGVNLGTSPANTQSGNILIFDGDSQTQGLGVPSSSFASLIIAGTYPTTASFTVTRNLAIAGGLGATISQRNLAGGLFPVFQPASINNVFVGMIGVNDVSTGCGTFTTAAQCANYVFGLNAKLFKAWKDTGFRTVILPMIDGETGQGSVVVASNTATVDTFLAHGMTTGASVTVASSGNASLNGTYTITRVSNTRFTFTTSGVSNGTYNASAMTITNVVRFAAIKNAFNAQLRANYRAVADVLADTCSGADYDSSLNSSASFVSLCTDGAASSNATCNGVSCWQENSGASNLHPSAAGYLMMVQAVRNAIDRAYDGRVYAAGIAPTIASGFGTSPSIAGRDSAGRVTVGTGGSDTSGVITFGQTWKIAPACIANNETTSLAAKATATTTTLTIASGSAFTAGDKITYQCVGY